VPVGVTCTESVKPLETVCLAKYALAVSHIGDALEYHFTIYGAVPPAHVAVRVIPGGGPEEDVMVGAVSSPPITFTNVAGEVAVANVASVTI